MSKSHVSEHRPKRNRLSSGRRLRPLEVAVGQAHIIVAVAVATLLFALAMKLF